MRKWYRCLAAVLSASMLFAAGGTTAKAASSSVPAAPVSAEELLQQVNLHSAMLGSARKTMTETIRMTDSRSGKTVSADLVIDITASRRANHTVTSMNMTSSTGVNRTSAEESWAWVENGIRSTYNKSGEKWKVSYEQLSETQLAQLAYQFAPAGVDASGASVIVEGSNYKINGVVNPVNMQGFLEVLNEVGITTSSSAFPVTVVVDVATLLPVSMTVEMTGLSVSGLPKVTASATAVTTYSGYGQYDTMTVPAEVAANAA